MPETRTSIRATYDHRETGDRYTVTSKVNGRPVVWDQRIPDPFVRHTVHIGWRDLLKSLMTRRGMTVEVTVGGDRDVIEDVLELNEDYLGPNCTRRQAFDAALSMRIRSFAEEAPDA
jgi:hypothetical protein